jgi:hypothetical protein
MELSFGYIASIYHHDTATFANGSRGRAPDSRYHPCMALSGRSFDPTRRPPAPSGPVVDYTLARRSLLASLRRGTLDTGDVCDAHPELMRAAKHIGEEAGKACPICSHDALRWVRYVYGDDLKRNSGRVVYPPEWLDELARSHDHFTCYVVEVCVDCAWNHLIRAFSAGLRYTQQDRASGQRRRG